MSSVGDSDWMDFDQNIKGIYTNIDSQQSSSQSINELALQSIYSDQSISNSPRQVLSDPSSVSQYSQNDETEEMEEG